MNALVSFEHESLTYWSLLRKSTEPMSGRLANVDYAYLALENPDDLGYGDFKITEYLLPGGLI